MMQMIELLEKYRDDPHFGAVIAEAISFVNSVKILGGHLPEGAGQSSKSLAELHKFRKDSKYYTNDMVSGLEKTIEKLESDDVIVRLGVVETDHGHVALWVNSQDTLLGAMIFRTTSHKG